MDNPTLQECTSCSSVIGTDHHECQCKKTYCNKCKKLYISDSACPICEQLLYKTELCNSFQAYGECSYAKKCKYAHGKAELLKVKHPSNRKTAVCRQYYLTGLCTYANRCTYIHADDYIPRKNRLLFFQSLI